MGFHVADYIVFVTFLVVSMVIGLFYGFRGGRQRTTSEYLMGNRQLKTLPVAISITVSVLSSVLVLGQPAEIYTRGTLVVVREFGHILACLLTARLIVPLFFNLRVTSSFEYLEKRYQSKIVKLVGSVSMLLSMTIQCGIVLYAPAVALEAVNGIPIWISIMSTTFVSMLYTTIGGMKAVIYTDVFQAVCMVSGMLLMVIQGCFKVGSVRRIFELNDKGGRLELFNFNPDPTIRMSFWSALLGGAFSVFSSFGVGQTTVQRYCSLPTLKQAKRSLYINSAIHVCIFGLATSVGLVIYAFYAQLQCDPIRMKYISNSNQLVPYFVSEVLNYPGLPGAFLSVLFGGALSTMSSTLNSAAAVTWQDIVKYFFTDLSESRKTSATKMLVVLYGVLAMAIAFLSKYMGGHVLQGIWSVMGTFSGPILGLFMLGALFPFANAKGALAGCGLGTALNVWILIGCFVTAPHKTTLPTSIDGCNNSTLFRQFGNITTPGSSDFTGNTDFSTHIISDVISDGLTTDSSEVFRQILSESEPRKGLYRLYSISFLLYPAIGFVVTMVVGVIVSLATTTNDERKVDPDLMIPIFDRLCYCLSPKTRQTMHCGMDYSVSVSGDEPEIVRSIELESMAPVTKDAPDKKKSSLDKFKDKICNEK